MVFRSHSHHQHTAGHCLSMLCAPSYGHWFTILDTEANLIISALAPGPCPSPQPPMSASILTFSHCRVAGGFPPRATQGSSRFCPARTCPSSKPGQSMTGGPGGTGEQGPLSGPGRPIYSLWAPKPAFSFLRWVREMAQEIRVLAKEPKNLTSIPGTYMVEGEN